MMPQLLAHLFGDYILQSDWMAQNKAKHWWPALCHALLYSLCFVWLCWHVDVDFYKLDEFGGGVNRFFVETSWGVSAYFHWKPWLVIFSTHFLIDRFRLARYVVWAKNFIAPPGEAHYPMFEVDGGSLPTAEQTRRLIYHENWKPWRMCDRTGYSNTTPIWLSTWLLIIADNTLHLAINYAALRWL